MLPQDPIHQSDAEHPEEDGRVLLALGRRLRHGDVLAVATDLEPVTEAEVAILRAFAWATGVSLLLALIGGALMSGAFLRKIDEINRTTRAIMAGNLSERIQTDGTQDELDRLGSILNEMLDRMQDLMDGLKQVSNDTAHDLRTPLSRLKQGLEAVRHDATTRQKLETAIDAALEEANTALSTFSAVAEDLGKVLTGQIVDDICVRADRELLMQAFANLIENALCHTPSDTKIHPTVKVIDGVPVAAVRDDGPGIPDDEQDKVLTRFYRLEQSRTTPGSGLGLALVSAIAALHGARLELSNNHPGLTITLWFDRDVKP